MCRVVGLLQPLRTDMGIDLGRREAGMAKQGLHAAQIRPIVQQVSGKAVTQLVRADAHGQTGESRVFLDNTGNSPGRDARF